jgi:hypothetical protein
MDISQDLLHAEICKKNTAPQKFGLRFVQACAVETHMNMSQEPFYASIYRKNATPQERENDFLRACTVEMHIDISQEPFYARILRKNTAPLGKLARQTLHESAQSKSTWTCHKRIF